MVWWRSVAHRYGNHSRTGYRAETAIIALCTDCNMMAHLAPVLRKLREAGLLTEMCLELCQKHLFDQFAAADISCVSQLIKRVHGIVVKF